MATHIRIVPNLAAAVALSVGALALQAPAQGQVGAQQPIPFAETKMIFEVNATDRDAGIQIFLDAESWTSLRIVSPNGRQIFGIESSGGQVQSNSGMRKIGLTELFFEGEEPSLDDVPLEELLALFPAGEYGFHGRTIDGGELIGMATLSHAIPGSPRVVAPEGDTAKNPSNAVLSWTSPTNVPGIRLIGYQVVVERAEPFGVFSIDVPATITSVTVPPEFLEAGTRYKYEVLAIEASGNQTITESVFVTR